MGTVAKMEAWERTGTGAGTEAERGTLERAGRGRGHGEKSWDKPVQGAGVKAGAGRKTGRDGRGEGGEEHFPGRTTGINRVKTGENVGKTALSPLLSQDFPARKLAHGG